MPIEVDPLINTLSIASSGMESQARRLSLVSENISNADTPGYHRKLTVFSLEDGRVEASRTVLDRSVPREAFEPAHPMADERGIVSFSNVNVLVEMADAREASRGYQANLQVFDQARTMNESLWALLRS